MSEMRDLVDAPGFVHLPPRERAARHGLNKIRDRVARDFTREEYDALCEAYADGAHDRELHEQGLDCRDTYKSALLGQKVRVVFDSRYEVIVTVLPGWHEARLK